MGSTNFFRLLIASAVVAAPAWAAADSIARDDSDTTRAGEMEHVEVTGKNYSADGAGGESLRPQGLAQRLLQQQKTEQLRLLKSLQRQQLERLRARGDKEALASEREQQREAAQEEASAEALRLERQRAEEELRRREEERSRTEAQAGQEPS